MKKMLVRTRNSEYQIIQALKLNRLKRHKSSEVFVEGIESIKQAVNAGLEITRIIIYDETRLSNWGKHLIRDCNAQLLEMPFELYKELCDRDEPSEMLITVKAAPMRLRELSLPEKPFILIFDRPSDHGNLGSLIRSANSFEVDAIFVIGHAIDIFDPKVIRASLGSIFHSKIINIQSMQELERWMEEQKQRNNISLVGTDSAGDVSLKDHGLSKPIALVLGNEAKGMSVALKNMCDLIISIPLSGAVNSLNVACAGSILMWDVYKNSGR